MSSPSGKTREGLAQNQQGAVMIIGLFMAISLIGSLWFILGIGDAIILRDKAVEASDHAAFSAATVHARGMNYISALNLIMFALASIYVLLATLADIVIGAGILSAGWGTWIGSSCLGSPIPPPLAAIGKVACQMGHAIAKVATTYNKALKGVFKAMGFLEDAVQMGFPVVAEASAVTLIQNYQTTSGNLQGAVISPSIVPIKSINKSDKPIGLPVQREENKYLCERTFTKVKGVIKSYVPAPASTVAGWGLDLVGYYLSIRSPDDPDAAFGIGYDGAPWTDKDIHIVNPDSAVKNGSDYFQMWGLVVNVEDKEVGRAEQRVSMSKNKGHSVDSQKADKKIYFSQAEYFFDCTKAWTDKECYDGDDKNASFSMNWRARLRLTHPPSFGNQFIGAATGILMSGSLTGFAGGLAGGTGAGSTISSGLGSVASNPFFTRTGAGNAAADAQNFLNGDRPIH
ncbi:hypothetical protein LVJ94_21105 [Pendulispora rubella]|uniref:Flp pilus-assembly TadG-like N-terminal domain-containing protein n=1 Tax=Pendulispora rubella TaxID=2741070 RepID=A0ABZ2LH77_9BACT